VPVPDASPAPDSAPASSRALVWAAFAVVLGTIWLRPTLPLLAGVDAGCYARVAREIAERPLSAWPEITLGGNGFYEHPPQSFWLESLVFRAMGASVLAAVAYARLLATALALLVFEVARRLAGPRTAAICMGSLVLLSGFLYESQNPMLELPLTVGLGSAALGALLLERRPFAGSALFAIGFTFAALAKGPPALAAFPVLAWSGWRRRARWRDAALAAGAAVVLLAAAVALFESARAARGLPPFFPRYLGDQVRRSSLEGREWAAPGEPFYYLGPLWRWHTPLLPAIPLSIWAWRRLRGGERLLVELGWVCAAAIVVGFSLPVQKAGWYIHPVMFGGALFMGSGLAALPLDRRRDRAVAAAAVAAALGAAAVTAWLAARPSSRGDLYALHHLPPPRFAPGEPNQVSDCGTAVGDWRTEHLLDFLWRARRVPCEAPAPYRFAGAQLIRQPWP